jgi:RNA polymerase sigma-70 factor (ECF subfamily)
MDQKRLRQMLDGILDRMHPDLRVVFVLFEFEEMNSSEVAEALGIPRGTVASRLRRARALFQARVRQLQGAAEREGER